MTPSAIRVPATQTDIELFANIESNLYTAVIADSLDELSAGPAGLRDTDHRRLQPATAHQLVQRGKDLPVAQIAGGAEQHQRISLDRLAVQACLHRALAHDLLLARSHAQPLVSTWPPKPSRIAESNLSANSARPRDSKRA